MYLHLASPRDTVWYSTKQVKNSEWQNLRERNSMYVMTLCKLVFVFKVTLPNSDISDISFTGRCVTFATPETGVTTKYVQINAFNAVIGWSAFQNNKAHSWLTFLQISQASFAKAKSTQAMHCLSCLSKSWYSLKH